MTIMHPDPIKTAIVTGLQLFFTFTEKKYAKSIIKKNFT